MMVDDKDDRRLPLLVLDVFHFLFWFLRARFGTPAHHMVFSSVGRPTTTTSFESMHCRCGRLIIAAGWLAHGCRVETMMGEQIHNASPQIVVRTVSYFAKCPEIKHLHAHDNSR
jgi:hypothetical protein